MNVATLASLIAAAMNDPTDGVTPPPNAVRAYLPDVKVEDLQSHRVVVMPHTIKTTRIARGRRLRTMVVIIALQRQWDGQASAVESDVDYSQAIEDWLIDRSFTGAKFVSSEIGDAYLVPHLREQQLFTAVITATFDIDVAG